MPKALEGQIVMEKTPRYFVTVETPPRVHAMAKDVKLIVVVRDPVTRAISDYTQIISKTPDIPPFEILAFKNRTTGTVWFWNQLFPVMLKSQIKLHEKAGAVLLAHTIFPLTASWILFSFSSNPKLTCFISKKRILLVR